MLCSVVWIGQSEALNYCEMLHQITRGLHQGLGFVGISWAVVGSQITESRYKMLRNTFVIVQSAFYCSACEVLSSVIISCVVAMLSELNVALQIFLNMLYWCNREGRNGYQKRFSSLVGVA